MTTVDLGERSDGNVSASHNLSGLGFAMVTAVLSGRDVQKVLRELADSDVEKAGKRRLLDAPWCMELAHLLCIHGRLKPILGRDAKALDCTLFVKSRATNWLVPLHQDLSIPADERG